MSDSSSEGHGRRAGINEPAMRVALVLSLLVHAAALWRVPMDFRPLSFEDKEPEPGRFTVRLAPPPAPPAALSMPSTPARERAAQAAAQPSHRAAPPPRQERPVIALAKPAPDVPAPRQQPPAPPAQPAPRAPAGDLSTYIEARRRARGEQSPSVASAENRPAAPASEDENARANRIAAANVGADRTPTFGSNRLQSGGVFHIQRVSLDYAEFLFFGWNKDISRNTSQLIEVRRGNAPDIRIAVVRRMIAIIRDYETEDFVWESQRLGRYLTLSARLKDNAGLEDFMMREFFEVYRGP